jgi:hypothetical protein
MTATRRFLQLKLCVDSRISRTHPRGRLNPFRLSFITTVRKVVRGQCVTFVLLHYADQTLLTRQRDPLHFAQPDSTSKLSVLL